MGDNVIKSFLVGLGFGVDDTSLKKFNSAITSATVRVTALYTSIKVMSAGIFYGISKISEGFEQMGYEMRIIAPMINKTLVLRRELLKAYGAAGINITKVVRQSLLFNMSLTKTKFALEAVYKSVGAKFLPMLTKQMDIFRGKIYANMPKIQNALEKFVKFMFKSFEATVQLGTRLWSILTRVYDFFVLLDEKTNGWSTKILAVVAAWKVLNLSFMATPLGMIITGMVALLALYDDFMTYSEGGEALVDWSQYVHVIEAMKKAVMDVVGAFELLWNIAKSVGDAISKTFTQNAEKIANFASGIKNKIGGFFGSDNVEKNVSGSASGAMQAPIGQDSYKRSMTNQEVNQQTQINIQGSPDANAVGKAVAGEQNRVNFDMTRNLKSPTR